MKYSPRGKILVQILRADVAAFDSKIRSLGATTQKYKIPSFNGQQKMQAALSKLPSRSCGA